MSHGTSRGPFAVTPAEGRVVSVAGDRYVIKVSGEESGGAYALFDFLILPGNGPPPHVHHREDEGFYLLAGELTFYLGAERRPLVARAGDFVHAARDVPHFFRNETDQPAHVLALVAPAGLERFFLEVGVPLAAPTSDPVPASHEQIAAMIAAAPRYGLEIFAPPG